VSTSGLVVEEPPQPARLRRTSDLLWAALWTLLAAGALAGATLATETVGGIEEDVSTAVGKLPELLLTISAAVSGLLLVALPVVVLGVLAIRRQWGTGLQAALAGAVAYGVTLGFAVRVGPLLPESMFAALTTVSRTGAVTQVAVPLLAGVVSFVSVVGLAGRPRLGLYAWSAGLLFVTFAFAEQSATPLALLVSFAAGRVVGLLARYAFGTENPRPTGAAVADAVARVGLPLARIALLTEDGDVGRWYQATTQEGSYLDLLVFDRDRRALGVPGRLLRRVRLLPGSGRGEAWTVQGATEQAVGPAMVATANGVRVPRVVAASAVSPDATVVAYEGDVGRRPLADLNAAEVSDELVLAAWEQLAGLRACGVSHGALSGQAIQVGPDGSVWLSGMQRGHVAAQPMAIRIDQAALLIVTAQYCGPQRAVTSARLALGESELSQALPFLQPLALAPEVRSTVRRNSQLIESIREEAERQGLEASESVRLERVRIRTLVAGVVLGAAVYLLLAQLGNINLRTLVTDVQWEWVAVAAAFSFLTYVGAAMAVQAFAPVRVNPLVTLVVQFASTVVALVTTPTVGPVTNVRYYARAGASASLAAASFGVAGVFFVISYVVLLLTFAVLAGNPADAALIPGRLVVLVVGAAVLLASVLLAVAPARRLLVRRLGPVVAGTAPRLLEALRQPGRVLMGLSGALLLNLAYGAVLFAAVHAYGASINPATAGFVFLAAGVLGNAAPTPGGIGAVEAATAAGLTAVGVSGPTAVQAALLFRAVTFWIPVAIGWFAMAWAQRRDVL